MNKIIFILFVTGFLGSILSGLIWLFKSDQAQRMWNARQQIALTRWMDALFGRERFIKMQKAVLLIPMAVVSLAWLCLTWMIMTDSLPPVASGRSHQMGKR